MLRKNRDAFFWIAVLSGILEIRTKKPDVKQLRVFAAHCALQQEMERRCFHSEGKISHWGKPALWARRGGLDPCCYSHSAACGCNRSRASSLCQKRQIAGFFQILPIYLWAWMTLPLSCWVLKALPFLYLLVFSCISSFEQRNIANTELCRDKSSLSQARVGLGGAGVAGSLLFPCNMQSLFFSEEAPI